MALLGCGGMGRANLGACAGQADVVVLAACDPWKPRRDAVVAQWKDTCKPYHDYREVLEQKDVDAVIIATPPHWHALMAVDACEAGKDLYIQKPMTLHLAESLAVRDAVKKHGRISQIGTQIHASQNYRRVVELVQAGNLGPIPLVRTFNIMHKIVPEGDRMDGMETPEPSIPPSPGHEREWLDSIKSRQEPSCSVFYHVKVDVPLVLGNLSYRLGRSIRFDPATERIVGDEEAARLAKPEYRDPWKFPDRYLA